MNLYDEDQMKKENNKDSKLNTIIIISMILVTIIIISIVCAIYYLKNNTIELTMNIDGVANKNLQSILKIETKEDGNVSIYAPIKKFAEVILGHSVFDGEYNSPTQDKNICNTVGKQEVAVFYLDSNIIGKKDLTVNNSEFEFYDINEKIFEKDGVLYAYETGLEKAFNMSINYDKKRKALNIYTIDSYVKDATQIVSNNQLLKQKETVVDSEVFSNAKAILDNKIVIISNEGGSKKYGVINYDDLNVVLDSKYEAITYLPEKKSFLVKMNNKIGIMDSDGKKIINVKYDQLQLIDRNKELYLAKKDGLYGIINTENKNNENEDKEIIHFDYTQIGINANNYPKNNVSTGYIIFDKLIPVKRGDKWGLLDKDGNVKTGLIYDNIGSISSKGDNLLIIPEYNYIVVKKQDGYNLVNENGEEIFNRSFADMYMETYSGEVKYYIVSDDNKYDLIETIKRQLELDQG